MHVIDGIHVVMSALPITMTCVFHESISPTKVQTDLSIFFPWGFSQSFFANFVRSDETKSSYPGDSVLSIC